MEPRAGGLIARRCLRFGRGLKMPKRNLIYLVIVVAVAATAVVLVGLIESNRRRHEAELQIFRDAYDRLWNAWRASRTLGSMSDLEKASKLLAQGRSGGRLTDEECRKVLMDGACKGMVEAMQELSGDPYWCFVPSDQKLAFENRIRGIDRGLGLQVQVKGGWANVTGVLGGSPSHCAGIVPGDRIIAVNGKDVSEMESDDVKKTLKGLTGNSLELTVIRASGLLTEAEVERIRVAPGEFTVQTVEGLRRDSKGEWVYQVDADDGICYLRITEFVNATAEQLQEAMRKAPSPRGLVLDLRGNPGGQPDAAAEVANLFVNQGRIFTIVNIEEGKPHEKPYMAHDGPSKYSQRIVVLMNGQTASAAEVVAGAMRLHGRAGLVGGRTCGKTFVQSVVPNGNMGLFIMSAGRPYLGVPGKSDSIGKGFEYVDPDRPVQIYDSVLADLLRLRARAAALPGKPAFKPLAGAARPLGDELLRLDAQLALGIALLKDPQELEKILKSECPWAKPDHE